jgi:hypothetical protein
MKKVSFDFDDTLGHNKEVQDYAEELVSRGVDVHIVTSRYDSVDKYTEETLKKFGIKNLEKEHNYLFEVADRIGIKRENIHFTNMTLKYGFFKENKDFIFHLDDNDVELRHISSHTKTKGVDVFLYDWKEFCEYILNKEE